MIITCVAVITDTNDFATALTRGKHCDHNP